MSNRIRHIISVMCACLLLSFIFPEAYGQSSSDLSEDLLNGVLKGMGADVELDDVIAAMERGVKSQSDVASINGALNYLDNIFANNQNSYNGYADQNFRKNFGMSPMLPGSAVLPVTGRITSRFGYRPSFGRMHKGVDIGLQIGDTIVAAMDGTVERVSVDPKGYGLFVCIKHPNGMETRYAHLSKSLVSPGMNVNAGEPMALGGNTGNSTGPHLHFETRVNGTALDPTTMFDFTNPGNFTRTRRTLADLDDMVANRNMQQGYFDSGVTQDHVNSQPKKRTYVVKAGDTVASVAHKNGISILSLCRLNMLSTNDVLQPGRMLKIR